MKTPHEMLQLLHAEPFHPFRIHMASGKTFDVGRPKMMRVGRESLLLFTPTVEDPDVWDGWQTVSLARIDRVSPLDSPLN